MTFIQFVGIGFSESAYLLIRHWFKLMDAMTILYIFGDTVVVDFFLSAPRSNTTDSLYGGERKFTPKSEFEQLQNRHQPSN